MFRTSIWLFLLGLINLSPFIVWIIRSVGPQRQTQMLKETNTLPSSTTSFGELFTGIPSSISWAVVMSIVLTITCFVYIVLINKVNSTPVKNTILAIILLILTIPSFITLAYSIEYMQTDMYKGALERVNTMFTTGNCVYMPWLTTVLIYPFSSIGTILTNLTFFYLAYVLYTRQSPLIQQLAGKRRY